LPCIPSFPVMKTRRHKAFIRGTFTTGPDGTGSMVFAPNRLANNYPATSNYGPPLIYTNGTTSGSVQLPTVDDGSAIVTSIFDYESYNTDYVEPIPLSTNTRVVGAGLRTRYVGTELNRGGVLHCVEQPNHETLSDLYVSDISQLESYFREPITREWTTLVYTPVLEREMNFNDDPPFTVPINYLNDTHFMGFIFAAANVGVTQQFDYEAVVLFEAVGPLIRDLVLSDCDPIGLAMVQNVIRPETQLVANESGPGRIFDMIRAGADMITTVAPHVGRAASIISGYM